MFGISRTPLGLARLAATTTPRSVLLSQVRGMASKTLFVGNLSWTARTDDLAALFSPFGEVKSIRIMTDRETGRSRGFGFVEMEEEAALKAANELNGTDFRGRDLRVNEAEQRQPRQTAFGSRPDRSGASEEF
ncbi:hypothetical protein HK104_008153 [Borealophlyctis nickersoniae]|nr:hypothetical protein HK104_008153 [Borealophlyctis nickersoniae]